MTHYLKKYPLTLIVICIIFYLSFFTPPKTDMEEIPGIDKIVHICMYGGLCTVLWIEYFHNHRTRNYHRMFIGGILCPILMSGVIELLQEHCTTNRGGDWLDFAANSLGVLLAAALGKYAIKPIFWGRRNAGDSHEQPTQ